jgi:uncharacterized protein
MLSRAAQGAPSAAHEARRLLGQCLDHLSRATVRIVIVGGLPGTDPSTLATAMGPGHDWETVRSDVVPTQLARLDPTIPKSSACRHSLYSTQLRARPMTRGPSGPPERPA